MFRGSRCLFGVLLCTFATIAFAQGVTSSITGVVTDTSQAVVPSAKVTVKNLPTGVATTTETNSAGVYNVPGLSVGTYELEVQAQGFKTAVRPNIVLDPSSVARVDITLQVGALTETVTVSGEAPLLNPEASEEGTVVTRTMLDTLPIQVSGTLRDPISFIRLTPGASGGTFQQNISGGRAMANEVMVDGVPTAYNAMTNTTDTAMPSWDTIGEFHVVSGIPAAEYGRTSGGVVALISKSGTNALHGSTVLLLRNNIFDARRFNADKADLERQAEFTGSLGGPVYIPKVYNGKNRTFFFTNYSGFRLANDQNGVTATVATDAMRRGDFSGLAPIYDPTTGQPFPGNIISPERITDFAKTVQAKVPPPNAPGLSSNYIGSSPLTYSSETFLAKIDHLISDKNRFSGSFRFQNNTRTFGYGPLPADIQGWFDTPNSRNAVVSDDYIIRPSITNRFQAGYTRFGNPQRAYASLISTGLLVPGAFSAGFPAVNFTAQGLSSLGGTGYDYEGDDNYDLQDSLSWTTGRHNFKFGARVDQFRFNNVALDNQPGTYNFSPFATAQPGISAGNAYASFLLGLVDSASMATGTPIAERSNYFGAFAQDDFKVTRRLTLNLGLRWEFQNPWYEAAGRLSQMDPNLPNPGAGGQLGALVFAGNGPGQVGGKGFAHTWYGGIAPRVGFAYQLTAKTVVRAGYAMMYPPLVADNINTQGYNASVGVESQNGGYTPAFNITTGWPAGIARRPPFLDPTFANGEDTATTDKNAGFLSRTSQWQFNVQRMFGKVLVSASYLGTVAHGIPNNYLVQINQLDPRYLALGPLLQQDITDPAVVAAGYKPPYEGFEGSLAQALRPYPQYGNIQTFSSPTGNSTYNAFLLKVEKRFSNGLQFLVSYSVSKTLTDVGFGAFGNTNWATPSGAAGPQDQFNRRAEKSLANTDIPQVLILSYTYQLPFGKGKPFLKSGVSSRILGGFTIAGIHTYQAAGVLHIGIPNDLPIFNGYLRPDRVPGVPIRIGPDRGGFQPLNGMTGQPGDVMLNRDAFATPAPFSFGNLGVFLPDVRGFGFRSEDISILRRFGLPGEGRFIQFRGDFFNAFNRRNLNNPITDLTDPNFGRITGQANPRVAQFGFRLEF